MQISPTPDSSDTAEFRVLFEKPLAEIRRSLANGEEPIRTFHRITDTLITIPGVVAATFFQRGESLDVWSVIANSGETLPNPPEILTQQHALIDQPGNCYLNLYSGSDFIGTLGYRVLEGVPAELRRYVEELADFLAAAHQRSTLLLQAKHYSSRLEVLNALNELIASGTSYDKVLKVIAREAAFRFDCDLALCLLLTEGGDSLEVRGSFGCSSEGLPKEISLHNTLLGRALRIGGTISIPDLRSKGDAAIEFALELGISCAHYCSIEVLGDTLGAIVIGYKHTRIFSSHDNSMFEEFAQGAAVAIANAKTQARLTTYAEKLEELVEQRTADLAVQTAKAEEANLAKSRFVANMSHELRTPLTAIVGYSSVLADGVFGPVTDKQKDALVAITRSSDHLRDLIDDVLNLSRIEAGKEQPEPTQVALQPLLQQVYKLIMQTAMGKGVKLAPLALSPEIADKRLYVDARHIRQTLINLLSNAVKYTPAGGTVTLEACIVGDKAKLTVTDTGVGISPEQKEKLFQRFERGDGEYARAQTGTGIGLSLTKHLVELNGGRIDVESAPGRGSAFWLLIPLADTNSVIEVETATSDQDAQTPRLNGLNVLIVDDNQLACQVLGTVVERAGGKPFLAGSVAEAKKIASSTSFDTALIDLAMSGETGLDLIDYFRHETGKTPNTVPLIVVSACVFERDRQAALEHGASYFIAKPFHPSEVVHAIRHLTTASLLGEKEHFRGAV